MRDLARQKFTTEQTEQVFAGVQNLSVQSTPFFNFEHFGNITYQVPTPLTTQKITERLLGFVKCWQQGGQYNQNTA